MAKCPVAFRPFKTNMKNGEAEYLKFDFLDDNVCFQMFVYGYWKKGLVHIESVKKKKLWYYFQLESMSTLPQKLHQ